MHIAGCSPCHLSDTRRTRVSASTPVVWSPPVERRVIGRPRCAVDTLELDVVDGEIDGAPAVVDRLGWGGCTHETGETKLHRTEFGVGTLRINQCRSIRTAAPVRPPQLDRIVLPETHFADLVGAWRLSEHQMPTARARVLRLHDRSVSAPDRQESTRIPDCPEWHPSLRDPSGRAECGGVSMQGWRPKTPTTKWRRRSSPTVSGNFERAPLRARSYRIATNDCSTCLPSLPPVARCCGCAQAPFSPS